MKKYFVSVFLLLLGIFFYQISIDMQNGYIKFGAYCLELLGVCTGLFTIVDKEKWKIVFISIQNPPYLLS